MKHHKVHIILTYNLSSVTWKITQILLTTLSMFLSLGGGEKWIKLHSGFHLWDIKEQMERRAKWQDQNYLLLFYLQANVAATICLHASSCKNVNEHFISQWTNTIFFVCLLTHLFNKSLLKAQDIIIALERDLWNILLQAPSLECRGKKKAGPANNTRGS